MKKNLKIAIDLSEDDMIQEMVLTGEVEEVLQKALKNEYFKGVGTSVIRIGRGLVKVTYKGFNSEGKFEVRLDKAKSVLG